MLALKRSARSSSAPALTVKGLVLLSAGGWLAVAGLAGTLWWQERQTPQASADFAQRGLSAGLAASPAKVAEPRLDMAGAPGREIAFDLAALEPAAGGGGGHGEAKESASGEGGHAASGKQLGKAYELPTVMIGNLKVQTTAAQKDAVTAQLLPKSLADNASKGEMGRVFRFTPYVHNPTRGPLSGVLTVVEFSDLACVQCYPDMKTADDIQEKNPDKVREVAMHLPLSRYSDTNVAAFYGKVAQRAGKYWEYRKQLMASAAAGDGTGSTAGDGGVDVGGDANTAQATAFQSLMDIGLNQAQVRTWLTREARRYYRELDADAALGRALGLDNPPHFYLNGVHVGEQGLPRSKMADLGSWMMTRNAYKLDSASAAAQAQPNPQLRALTDALDAAPEANDSTGGHGAVPLPPAGPAAPATGAH